MIFLIIAVNLSITLLNIYIAIRIWQLRQLVARIANIFTNYERYFKVLLRVSPKVLYRGQNNLYLIRRRYQIMELQATQLRQTIWLLSQMYQIIRKT